MSEFKFIDLEIIYLNYFKDINDEINYWKKFPHIFYPIYDEKRVNHLIYDKFKDIHLELVTHHNNLSIYLNSNKNIRFKYENIKNKYYENKENFKSNITSIKFGHEKFIESLDEMDRFHALENLDIYKSLNSNFYHLFNSLIYILFEDNLKNIALWSTTPDSKNDFNKHKKKFLNELSNIKNLSTYKKLAIIIDKNCNILDERKKILNYFNLNSKLKQFHKYRNRVVHGDLNNKQKHLSNLDCFNIVKEVFDYIYNNDQILSKMDKVDNYYMIE